LDAIRKLKKLCEENLIEPHIEQNYSRICEKFTRVRHFADLISREETHTSGYWGVYSFAARLTAHSNVIIFLCSINVLIGLCEKKRVLEPQALLIMNQSFPLDKLEEYHSIKCCNSAYAAIIERLRSIVACTKPTSNLSIHSEALETSL